MNSNQPSIFESIRVEETNLQSIFDRVKNHLLTQKVPAKRQVFNSGEPMLACSYRGHNETKCAVGCLIADEYYNPDFEGTSISSDDEKGTLLRRALEKSGIKCEGIRQTVDLLQRLQNLHDDTGLYSSWETGLKIIARQFQLKYETTISNI